MPNTDPESFIRWALDKSRTIEERYTTELFLEQAVQRWCFHHKVPTNYSLDAAMERKRQRALNPAYEPRYTEESVRRAAEMLPSFTMYSEHCSYDDRPIRDISVLRFLTALEDLRLNHVEVSDPSVLRELPRLRVLHFGSTTCEDLRPIADCAQLRELNLHMYKHWPDVSGLERLSELETLSLKGNLLTFQRGVTWPNVRSGALRCEPLAARSVRDLPQLPACESLTLAGVERLDGIEAFAQLRNLTIETPVRCFDPLEALQELTCFTCKSAEPLDLKPLTRLPKLYFASFDTRFGVNLRPIPPRDFSTLIDAPQLREVQVEGCKPVKSEVAALNAGLPSWDDLFLLPEARSLPALRIVVAPPQRLPRREGPHRDAGESAVIDMGLRECEARFLERFATRALNKKLGSDWGEVTCNGVFRLLHVTVESFSIVEKLPKVIDAVRSVLARLNHGYEATVMIALKAPRREPTAAERELEEKFFEEQDNAEFEQRQKDREQYLERLHRYQLMKEQGLPIKPEDFAAPTPAGLPPAPWEKDSDEDSAGEGEGGFAIKQKPEPPPSFLDDEHPLADNYRLMGHVTLGEVWFTNRDQSLVTYLMGRAPDEVIET